MSLELHNDQISPFLVDPHGDRLLVEVVEISSEVTVAGGHTLYTAPAERDARGIVNEEWKRGFCAGVVISAGDGHVLTTPSRHEALIISMDYTQEQIDDGVLSTVPGLRAYDPVTKQGIVVVDTPANVPMPWTRGDVILIERLAARQVRLGKRTYAIVDQMDVLATVRGLKYLMLADGEWMDMREALEQKLLHEEPQEVECEEVPV